MARMGITARNTNEICWLMVNDTIQQNASITGPRTPMRMIIM